MKIEEQDRHDIGADEMVFRPYCCRCLDRFDTGLGVAGQTFLIGSFVVRCIGVYAFLWVDRLMRHIGGLDRVGSLVLGTREELHAV